MRIRRVVTTRAGGRSAPPFDSFNLGDHVGDDPADVAANRSRLARELGLAPDQLSWMEQVHGRTVTVVDGTERAPAEATDALVTDRPGLALVALVADCVPILLGDSEAGVVAAVHAGRVGARVGVLPAALETMESLGARRARVEVLLGPAVCGQCYEVPRAMADDVEAHLPGSACRSRNGTPALDLRAGLWRQLGDLGVGKIGVDPRCTVEDETLFSHRRKAPTGRIAAVTWLEQ
ncbi:laccase [Saccharomonospora piscinae]|uniref:Purine nucleoside phosphorylase n=1 Tax=Saccharomonospora piscinae TaxID=687388 RepID=A0A1V9A4K1_SACPI|nr:peptidoglycan editing factor PgeF [Saccharomonospora piscinae]OQO92075.1 laccase [Saccharomonospora piscinae]TLW92480.1 peptidoglycan editing factor PgeF [Saccharomonospora piscinae]